MCCSEEIWIFYEITEEIEFESGPAVVQLFAKLHERVPAFTIELKAHSKMTMRDCSL
jgi:hypothetical protein